MGWLQSGHRCRLRGGTPSPSCPASIVRRCREERGFFAERPRSPRRLQKNSCPPPRCRLPWQNPLLASALRPRRAGGCLLPACGELPGSPPCVVLPKGCPERGVSPPRWVWGLAADALAYQSCQIAAKSLVRIWLLVWGPRCVGWARHLERSALLDCIQGLQVPGPAARPSGGVKLPVLTSVGWPARPQVLQHCWGARAASIFLLSFLLLQELEQPALQSPSCPGLGGSLRGCDSRSDEIQKIAIWVLGLPPPCQPLAWAPPNQEGFRPWHRCELSCRSRSPQGCRCVPLHRAGVSSATLACGCPS